MDLKISGSRITLGAYNVAQLMLQALLANRFKLQEHPGDEDCSVNVSVVTGGQSYTFSNCAIDSLVSVLGTV